MILPKRFSLTITGTTIDVLRRENVQAGAAYLLARLLTGAKMPEDVFRPWGLTIEVREVD